MSSTTAIYSTLHLGKFGRCFCRFITRRFSYVHRHIWLKLIRQKCPKDWYCCDSYGTPLQNLSSEEISTCSLYSNHVSTTRAAFQTQNNDNDEITKYRVEHSHFLPLHHPPRSGFPPEIIGSYDGPSSQRHGAG